MKYKMGSFLAVVVACLLASPLAFADGVHGVLQVVKGDVQIKSGKDGSTSKAKIGGKVFPKDTIVTGKDSRAKVVMVDNNVLNVSPESKIEIQSYEYAPEQGKKDVLLNVLYGKVRSKVEQKYDGKENKFQVKTPTAVAGVRGTDFIAGYDSGSNTSSVVTFHGSVEFGQPGPGGSIANSVPVTPGTMSSMSGNARPNPPVVIPPQQLAALDHESQSDAGVKDERQPAEDKRSDKDKKKDDGKGDGKADAKKDDSKGDGKADAKKDDSKGDGKADGKGDSGKGQDKGDGADKNKGSGNDRNGNNGKNEGGDKNADQSGDKGRGEGDKGPNRGGQSAGDAGKGAGMGNDRSSDRGDLGKGPAAGGSGAAGSPSAGNGSVPSPGGMMPNPGMAPREPAGMMPPMADGSMLRPEDFAAAPNSAVMPIMNNIMPVLPPPPVMPPPMPACDFCNHVIQDGNTTLNIHVTH